MIRLTESLRILSGRKSPFVARTLPSFRKNLLGVLMTIGAAACGGRVDFYPSGRLVNPADRDGGSQITDGQTPDANDTDAGKQDGGDDAGEPADAGKDGGLLDGGEDGGDGGSVKCRSSAECEDQNQCVVGEICAPLDSRADSFGCIAGTLKDTSDGVHCTLDLCNPQTGEVTHEPRNGDCEQLACKTVVCDTTYGCQYFPDPSQENTVCDAQTNPRKLCKSGQCSTVACTENDHCDDGKECTDNTCDTTNNICNTTPIDSRCDDGRFCNGEEKCLPDHSGADNRGCVVADTVPICQDTDGLTCTEPACDTTLDACTENPNSVKCENNLCTTGISVCNPTSGRSPSGCTATTPKDCSSETDTCNTGICDIASGDCKKQPVPNNPPKTCIDGDFCTMGDICNEGVCAAVQARDCGDGATLGCTVDTCRDNTASGNEEDGECVHTPDNALCPNTDGKICSVPICDPVTGCKEAPVNALCENGDKCFTHTCEPQNPANDSAGCIHTPNIDCTPSTNQCNTGKCNPATGACFADPLPNTPPTICTDNNYCSTSDTCADGTCSPGAQRDCSDPHECTADSCASSSGTEGRCVHTPNDATCGNTDGKTCTVPRCDTDNGCVEEPTNTLCNDANPCTGVETCEPLTGDATTGCTNPPDTDCSTATDQCNTGACHPADGLCHAEPVPNDPATSCNDGKFCTINDSCIDGTCASTSTRDCNDKTACTIDTCSNTESKCLHTASDTLCNDGNSCTITDKCDPVTGDPTTGCTYTAKTCTTTNPCKIPYCDTATGDCATNNKPDNTPCNDGNDCGTSNDKCTSGVCAGTPIADIPDNKTDDNCNGWIDESSDPNVLQIRCAAGGATSYDSITFANCWGTNLITMGSYETYLRQPIADGERDAWSITLVPSSGNPFSYTRGWSYMMPSYQYHEYSFDLLPCPADIPAAPANKRVLCYRARRNLPEDRNDMPQIYSLFRR